MKSYFKNAGPLFIAGALFFWISWMLMPDPGTTDTEHILTLVKQSRVAVLWSVLIQILSALCFLTGMIFLAKATPTGKRILTGMILFGIGVMGFCADAFFHLLAYFMTDEQVNIQQDVVQVMEFMQTTGVVILIPLLIPFFIGSLMMVKGLERRGIVSKVPFAVLGIGQLVGILLMLASKLHLYNGPSLAWLTIGVFSIGHSWLGVELFTYVSPKDEESKQAVGGISIPTIWPLIKEQKN